MNKIKEEFETKIINLINRQNSITKEFMHNFINQNYISKEEILGLVNKQEHITRDKWIILDGISRSKLKQQIIDYKNK